MLPKVALITPERKLLNLGVFVEKMKAQCLLLPPQWEGGRAYTASCKHPRGSAEHSTARQGHGDPSNCCSWMSKQPGCGCQGKSQMEGTAKPGWALEAGGARILCPMGRWVLSVVQCLASLHPSPGASASPVFQAVPTWQYSFNVIFFIFAIYVFLIEEEGERLGLTLCFCTVILTIRGRCKGMLNPGDGLQQTSDRSNLIS